MSVVDDCPARGLHIELGQWCVWDEDGELGATCCCVNSFLGKLVSMKMLQSVSEGSLLRPN